MTDPSEAQQPELVALREELAALKREKKQTALDNARVVRELESTIRVYASHIQVLTLRCAELENQLQPLARQVTDVMNVGSSRIAATVSLLTGGDVSLDTVVVRSVRLVRYSAEIL